MKPYDRIQSPTHPQQVSLVLFYPSLPIPSFLSDTLPLSPSFPSFEADDCSPNLEYSDPPSLSYQSSMKEHRLYQKPLHSAWTVILALSPAPHQALNRLVKFNLFSRSFKKSLLFKYSTLFVQLRCF